MRNITGSCVAARTLAALFVLASATTAMADERDGKVISWTGLESAPQASTRWDAVRSLVRPEPGDRVMVYVAFEGPPAAGLVARAADLADPAQMDRVRARVDQLRREHDRLRIGFENLGAIVVADLVRTANALQIDAPLQALDRIRKMPGVKGIYRVAVYERSTATAVPRVGAPMVWGSALTNVTGKGIRIGIIDTGTDYTHADLGGSGNPDDYKNNNRKVIEPGTFPTARVVGGWDFVGDSYTGQNSPAPDPDPLDCSGGGYSGGHGTHVSGIAAGNGVLKNGTAYTGPYLATIDPFQFSIGPGVAPEASIYALKIFGCSGATSMVASALEWASDPNNDGDMTDRLDVINMSLGSSYDVGNWVDDQQLSTLTKLGTSVVVAAGNDYNTFFVVGSPSTYTEAISIASTDNGPLYLALEVTAPASIAGRVPCAEGDFTKPLSTTGPVSGALVFTDPPDACGAIVNAAELAGKVALMNRGGCGAPSKFKNAADAGAIAAVVVDTIDSDKPGTMTGDGTWSTIPGVLIRKADGDTIKAKLGEGVSVTLDASNVLMKAVGKDNMSSFSSRGPRSRDMMLKPDLAAPGGAILSAAVGTGNGPAQMDGTSMACPMAAGGVALIRNYYPSLGASDVKALLMNTAAGIASGKGNPAPVSLGGSGRMALEAAIQTDVTAAAAEPAGAVSVSFGPIVAFDAYTDSRKILLTNHGSVERTMVASVEPTYALEGVTATTSAAQVTVPPNGTAEITLKLDVDPGKLPVPAPDGHTSAKQNDMSRHFLVEAAGHVRFDVQGTTANPVRVPYHAAVRAASKRTAGEVSKCASEVDGSVSIPITGESKNPDPITTAFELAATSPDDNMKEKWADLRAVGVATNLATAASFDDASIYFGVAVQGDWITPAQGQLSAVGISIDTNLDEIPDYELRVEAFSKDGMTSPFYMPYMDVLTASLYNLATPGEQPRQRYINMVPRDARDTEPFMNSVIVLPVTISDLGLVQGAAKFAFSAFASDPGGFTLSDQTDTVTWDPENALINTAKGGEEGRPIYAGTNPVLVSVNWKAKAANPLPSVLLLHHTNVPGERMEIVDLAAAGVAAAADLKVTATAPPPVETGAEVNVVTEVRNTSEQTAAKVKATWKSLGDGQVLSATSSKGTCASGSCELGDIPPQGSAKIEWRIKAGATGVHGSVTASSPDGCEKSLADNTVKVDVAATPVASDAGPSADGSAPKPAADAAMVEGGACSCRVGAASSRGQYAAHTLLGLALAIAVRRRRGARRAT